MSEGKSKMISARVPAALVDRVDFVVRNSEGVANRSAAVSDALSTWTAEQERELQRLGVQTPKK